MVLDMIVPGTYSTKETQRPMRWIVRIGLLMLVLLAGTWLWLRPTGLIDSSHYAVAYVNGWNVTVSYQPGKPETMISVRMDGLGRYQHLSYSVSSSQDWAPHWEAQIAGRLSEYLTLNDGWRLAPTPMTAELAEALARSYRVAARLGDEERLVDFSKARVEHTTTTPSSATQQRSAPCSALPGPEID